MLHVVYAYSTGYLMGIPGETSNESIYRYQKTYNRFKILLETFSYPVINIYVEPLYEVVI